MRSKEQEQFWLQLPPNQMTTVLVVAYLVTGCLSCPLFRSGLFCPVPFRSVLFGSDLILRQEAELVYGKCIAQTSLDRNDMYIAPAKTPALTLFYSNLVRHSVPVFMLLSATIQSVNNKCEKRG